MSDAMLQGLWLLVVIGVVGIQWALNRFRNWMDERDRRQAQITLEQMPGSPEYLTKFLASHMSPPRPHNGQRPPEILVDTDEPLPGGPGVEEKPVVRRHRRLKDKANGR